jgi:hypothetical protein
MIHGVWLQFLKSNSHQYSKNDYVPNKVKSFIVDEPLGLQDGEIFLSLWNTKEDPN